MRGASTSALDEKAAKQDWTVISVKGRPGYPARPRERTTTYATAQFRQMPKVHSECSAHPLVTRITDRPARNWCQRVRC